MSDQTLTLDQIRAAGLNALTRELGPVGMVRFLQQFETGRGDYSRERHEWLDDAHLTTVLDKLRKRRDGTH